MKPAKVTPKRRAKKKTSPGRKPHAAKSTAKAAPSPIAQSTTATGTHANGGREIEFAIAESGAILFKILRGPRAGELGGINHVDAMALFRLMDACDFIRDNA